MRGNTGQRPASPSDQLGLGLTTGEGGTEEKADRELSAVGLVAPALLMSIDHVYYERILDCSKHYEFRRRYVRMPTTLFLYVKAPLRAVAMALATDDPVVAPIEEIAGIAELQRSGSAPGVREYMHGLPFGFAIPIHAFTTFAPVTLAELTALCERFSPPQGYIRLDRQPRLLTELMRRVSEGTWTKTSLAATKTSSL